MRINRNLNSWVCLLLFLNFSSCHRRVGIAIHRGATLHNGSYPNYNISPAKPDTTGMNNTAVQLAAKMKVGWNIGNTLEAIGGETAWGNPKVTNDLIAEIKQSGFNAVRIPC